MKRIFLFVLMSLAVQTGTAQAQADYRLRQLNVDNGLPSNSVRAIVQDQRGFVWMGTDEGLCRYNGITMQHFPIRENGNEPVVEALLPMGRDSLLVGTSKGVFCFNFVTERYEELPLELKAAVSSMATDRDGLLWIATQGQGVMRYKLGSEQHHHYELSAIGGQATSVYADADNQIWVLTTQASPAVWRLNKGKDAFEPVPLQSDTPYGSASMLQAGDGRHWLGTWEHGLMLMTDDGRLEPMPHASAGHCLHIRTLLELSSHQLLVGCDDGLWLFHTATHTFTLYLPQHFVYAAMLDREGGLWAGTYYGGVTYVSPIAQRFDAQVGGVTPSFCEDAAGRLWVASDVGGVACYIKGQRQEHFAGQQLLQGLSVHTLCADGDDVWMGTYAEGLVVLNTVSGRIRRYQPGTDKYALPDAAIGALHRDKKGRMWVATSGSVCRYDRKSDGFERVLTLDMPPIDLEEDQDGRIWVAMQGGGLYRCNLDGRATCYHYDPADEATLSDDMVNCVLADASGNVWVGTQGGLCRYDRQSDRFRRVPLDVPKQAVASIVADQDALWLSGDCGVLKYVVGKGVQRFTRHDGLVSEQFLPNASLKGSDGRIYFGTIRGFNSFLPHKIRVNQQLPPVYITQAEVYNHPIEVGNWRLPVALSDAEKLDLWANDQMLSLSFASLSFCSPEKNIYAYMLEGFDKQWHYVGHDHKATYTNLPLGTYTFRVRATNNDGVWSDHEARLKVVVHPPLWWSLPARIAYVVLAVLLLWLALRLFLGRAERRHKKEMALLNETKEEEARNARMEFFTTIAHEIRTPVSLIIGPLEQLKSLEWNDVKNITPALSTLNSQLKVIDRNAHRLLELVNLLLDFRKVEQGRQKVQMAVLKVAPLLQAVADNFEPSVRQKGMDFKLTLPDERLTVVADREALVKLLSNLLSNAVKYTHDRVELACQVEADGHHYSISVSDNGRGISESDMRHVFDPFFQAKGSKPGTGIGLSIVKSIAQAHGGQVSVSSQVGQGTTFRVVLPISQEVANEIETASSPRIAGATGNTGQSSATGKSGSEGESGATAAPGAPAPVEKPTLLVVDDNEEMLTFLVTTFMDHYEVLPAHDGTEALKLLEESLVAKDGTPTSTISVVVSDWMMQQMDGPELCSRMRQNHATRHIPFVLLTAKTDSLSKVQAMEAGVDAFIEKPFPVKYLEACISNLLRRFKT